MDFQIRHFQETLLSSKKNIKKETDFSYKMKKNLINATKNIITLLPRNKIVQGYIDGLEFYFNFPLENIIPTRIIAKIQVYGSDDPRVQNSDIPIRVIDKYELLSKSGQVLYTNYYENMLIYNYVDVYYNLGNSTIMNFQEEFSTNRITNLYANLDLPFFQNNYINNVFNPKNCEFGGIKLYLGDNINYDYGISGVQLQAIKLYMEYYVPDTEIKIPKSILTYDTYRDIIQLEANSTNFTYKLNCKNDIIKIHFYIETRETFTYWSPAEEFGTDVSGPVPVFARINNYTLRSNQQILYSRIPDKIMMYRDSLYDKSNLKVYKDASESGFDYNIKSNSDETFHTIHFNCSKDRTQNTGSLRLYENQDYILELDYEASSPATLHIIYETQTIINIDELNGKLIKL